MSLLKSLLYSYDDTVESAYIITLMGNSTSEELANRCAESCNSVGMPHQFWRAFDGTNAGDIIVPPQLENQSWLKLIKFTSYKMTLSEIACAMSHISLWIKCIELDRPIVILEHDAILVQPYRKHFFRNSVCWLGNRNGLAQIQEGAVPLKSPPMPGETPTTIHIDTCQAYAVDPLSANMLLTSILDRGLYAPVDIMIKSNKFCITQTGIYNISENVVSTIDRHNNKFHYYGLDARQ
jgi:hypothetical protein